MYQCLAHYCSAFNARPRNKATWSAFYEPVDDIALPIDDTSRALLTSATASAASSRPVTPISDDDHDVTMRSRSTSPYTALDARGYTVFQTQFNPADPHNKKKPFPPQTSRRHKWTDTQRSYVERALAATEKALHPRTWTDFTNEVGAYVVYIS